MKFLVSLFGLIVFFTAPVAADIDHGWKHDKGDNLNLVFTYSDHTQGVRSLRGKVSPSIGLTQVVTDSLTGEPLPDTVLVDFKPDLDCRVSIRAITTTGDTIHGTPTSASGGIWNMNLKFTMGGTDSLVKIQLRVSQYSPVIDSFIFHVDNLRFFRYDIWELWDGFPDGGFGAEEGGLKRALGDFEIYPNPFMSRTISIRYSVPRADLVSLRVYDITGSLVKLLVNERKPAGTYVISWDGRNEKGFKVADGIYFYRLQTDDHMATKKMLIVR